MFTVFLQGRNLTDQDQRQHTSFIKDFAPMPGRTVEAGLRARF
jgi:iron complex outermembrane receptor protein